MDTDRSSHELLGHFDRPEQFISPEFDWDETYCGASEFDPAAVVDSTMIVDSLGARCARFDVAHPGRPQPPVTERPARVRGADWVLQWAGAVIVLAIATGVLVNFARGVAAEQALRIAARAGATEATLPKATNESVAAAVGRRLAAYPELKERVQLTLFKNGVPVGERLAASGGDRISLTISAPLSAVVPGWIARFALHRDESPMIVQAESQVPGRKLRAHLAKAS